MKSIVAKTLVGLFSACVFILLIIIFSACGNGYERLSDGTLDFYVNGKEITVEDCDADAEEIEIPSTLYYREDELPVTAIGSHAFEGCARLKKIKIPASIARIEPTSFNGCLNLTEIVISPQNPVYHSAGNCLIETQTKTLLHGFPSSEIPADGSVEVIGASAFYGCAGLAEVCIPLSVTQIESGAFENCDDIKSFTVEEGNANYSSADGILYNFERSEILIIPPKLEGEITVADGVEELADGAFFGRTGITSLVLPDSLKSIGANAFGECSGLKSLAVPFVRNIENFFPFGLVTLKVDGGTIYRKAFSNLKKLEEVTFGKGVSHIEGLVFYGLNSLGKLTFENAGCTAELNSFEGLGAVTAATVPVGLLESYGAKNLKKLRIATVFGEGEIADNTFEDSSLVRVVIADGITKIGNSAFKGSQNLNYVHLADSVEEIGSAAFRDCALLENAEIPAKVKVIREFTFKGCTSLKSVGLPEGLTDILANSFENCSSLKSVTIPQSAAYIGGRAFGGCLSLEKVNYNAANCAPTKTDNSWVFSGCDNLTEVVLGEKVEAIPARLFGFCKGLRTVTGGENVASIGESAFYQCTALESFEFSGEQTTIGKQAFEYCSSLESINVNAVEIDNFAFMYCSSLKTVILGGATESIREYVFKDCSLEKVFYKGNAQEWYGVYKSFGFDTATADAVIYYYSEERPATSGSFWHYADGVPQVWE